MRKGAPSPPALSTMNELQEDKKLSNPTVKWSDGWTTCLVTVELPRQVSKVTVTCDPLARRFSTIYRSFSGKPDTTVKLRLEQLHPNTETGYRFILKDGDEVLGWFKKNKQTRRSEANGEQGTSPPTTPPANASRAAGPAAPTLEPQAARKSTGKKRGSNAAAQGAHRASKARMTTTAGTVGTAPPVPALPPAAAPPVVAPPAPVPPVLAPVPPAPEAAALDPEPESPAAAPPVPAAAHVPASAPKNKRKKPEGVSKPRGREPFSATWDYDKGEWVNRTEPAKRKPAAASPAPPQLPPPGAGAVAVTAGPAQIPAAPVQFTPDTLSPEGLVGQAHLWFRSCTSKEKGERFERFMTWYMDNIWERGNHYKTIKCTGGPGDGGRDIQCVPRFSVRPNDLEVINCKNEATPKGNDLLYTMKAKLDSSRNGARTYYKAIAAIHPRFAKPHGQGGQGIAAVTQGLNRVLRATNQFLDTLEWDNGTDESIKAVLTDRLQDDFMRIKFHDRLLDGFELDDECHPKRFNHAEYLERVRALRSIRGPRCE